MYRALTQDTFAIANYWRGMNPCFFFNCFMLYKCISIIYDFENILNRQVCNFHSFYRTYIMTQSLLKKWKTQNGNHNDFLIF